MKISQKMTLGFGAIVILLVVVGLFGLVAGNTIIKSLQVGDRHLRSIVATANELSILAKNTENHLIHYLISHKDQEREDFFYGSISVANLLQKLEGIIEHPKSRELLPDIHKNLNTMLEEGENLIAIHDQAIEENRDLPLREMEKELRVFHASSSSLRKYGVQLAGYSTDFLNRQEAITAATDICSFAKRAEGHLLLYLTLESGEDRKKFFDRMNSMQKRIETLERRVLAPEAQSLLAAVKAHTSLVIPVCTALLEVYNDEKERTGSFNINNQLVLIQQLQAMIKQIVITGNALAKFNIELEVKTKEQAVSQALTLKGTIIGVIVFAVFFAVLLGYVLSRSIVKPVKELQAAMIEVGKGNFSVDVNRSATGEIGDLSATFLKMAENLKNTTISRDYVNSIIGSMADALVVISAKNRIKKVNDSFCNLFGYRTEEIIGKSFNILLSPQSELSMDDFDVYVDEQEIVTKEDSFIRKDGELIPVLFSISRIQTNSNDHMDMVCVIQDMSVYKAAEKAHRKYEVKVALSKMSSLVAIGELSSRIVHEMRNPLASIQMNLEALTVKVEDDPLYAEMADISMQQVMRLETMLSDILNYGKPLKLNKKQTTFSQINQKTLQFFSGRAKEKNITITVDDHLGEEPIWVDEELITRALTNIIDNSLYWTPEEGLLLINAEMVGTDIRIIVNDSGPGISREVRKKLFQPFITGRKGGTGLGLANVKKIIEYHGGTVLAGENDKGTVFTLQLPVKR